MLTLEQSQELNRCQKLSGFFDSNTAIIGTFAPFQGEVNSFTANLQSLIALVPNKDAITTGITAGKVTLKQSITDNLALVVKKQGRMHF